MSAVNRLLIIVLLILLVILYSLFALTGRIETPEAELIDSAKQGAIDLDPPQLKPVLLNLEQYVDLVERPLFVEGRRPVIETEEEDSEEDIGQLDDWILVGIFTNVGDKYALFTQKGQGKNHLKKMVGEDVAGWEITDINLQQVVLKKGLQNKTVQLRKPKPKQAPPQPVHKKTPKLPINNPFIKQPTDDK